MNLKSIILTIKEKFPKNIDPCKWISDILGVSLFPSIFNLRNSIITQIFKNKLITTIVRIIELIVIKLRINIVNILLRSTDRTLRGCRLFGTLRAYSRNTYINCI